MSHRELILPDGFKTANHTAAVKQMAPLPLCCRYSCSLQLWQNDLHRPTGHRLQILKLQPSVNYRRII